jgi:hypothetical protein
MSAPDKAGPQKTQPDLHQLQLSKYRFRARLVVAFAVFLGLILAALIGSVFWFLTTGLGDFGKYTPID